ncbi:MAG: hypothetical protein IJE10_11360 [Clostridia bacterium]|nr:hypothetical protein [Clostridia bacterium]
MELQEIEIRAANLEPLPGRSELDWYEQNLFLSLRNIYSMYHVGTLSKEVASKEKHVVISSYQKQREVASFYAALYESCIERSNKSEALRTAITKAKTKEEKGKLALECVYALTGDKMILKEAEAFDGA